MKKSIAITLLETVQFEEARLIQSFKDGLFYIVKRIGDKHALLFSSENDFKKVTMNNIYKNYRFSDDVLGDGTYIIK